MTTYDETIDRYFITKEELIDKGYERVCGFGYNEQVYENGKEAMLLSPTDNEPNLFYIMHFYNIEGK